MTSTDCKIIEIANFKTGKKTLLDSELAILILYYYQTSKPPALCEFTDGPTGQPVDNPSNLAGLGDIY